KTLSVWTHILRQRHLYINPLYQPTALVFMPNYHLRSLTFWRSYYMRSDPAQVRQPGLHGFADIYQVKLRHEAEARAAVEESVLASTLRFQAILFHYEERSTRLFSRAFTRYENILNQKEREISQLRCQLPKENGQQPQSPTHVESPPTERHQPVSILPAKSDPLITQGPFIIFRDGHYLDLSEL
ncbi:MAG: hypothetical protein Q8P67_25530, partial [archaeon]|nr:hypothetical protein [archaeon]